ncbi:hypothetical protein ABG067_007265 [Albugo candida]
MKLIWLDELLVLNDSGGSGDGPGSRVKLKPKKYPFLEIRDMVWESYVWRGFPTRPGQKRVSKFPI